MTYTLHHGDCLDVLPTLADDSVDLILTDPPYNGVKDVDWDNQWTSDAEYLAWLDRVLEQFERVLRFNGSLYLFASPRMAARVEVLVGGRFNVLNSIVWRKGDPGKHTFSSAHGAHKESLRSYFPETERVIFAEHYNSDNTAKGEAGYARKCDELRGFVFEPLRAYLVNEIERAGVSKEDINEWLGFRRKGGMAGRHYFSASQWCLPTKGHYHKMRDALNTHNHGGQYLRREYEDLRREYEDLRREYEDLRREYEDLRREYEDLRREYEDLRRPFSVNASVPYTDVWDFLTVQSYPGKHPCEKPQALLQHAINASSRPGGVVLDAFSGSCATGEAAYRLGRDFIGIEASTHWYAYGQQRMKQAQHEPQQLALKVAT